MKEVECVLRPKTLSKQRLLSLIAFITIIKVCNKHITHLPSSSSWKTGVRWTWCRTPKTFKFPWVTRSALEDKCLRGRLHLWFPACLQPGLMLAVAPSKPQGWAELMWHRAHVMPHPEGLYTWAMGNIWFKGANFPCTWTPQQHSCDPMLPLSWGTRTLGCSSFSARTFSVFTYMSSLVVLSHRKTAL